MLNFAYGCRSSKNLFRVLGVAILVPKFYVYNLFIPVEFSRKYRTFEADVEFCVYFFY